MIFGILSNIAYFISRNIFKITLIIFFKFKVKGGRNIPKRGSFIMASNHVSYVDPPAVGSACRRRLYFITSDHLYKNKLMALWYKAVGCLKIKRGRADHGAMKKILSYLKDGRPLAIFPEGTRSNGSNIEEPLAGIGFLALKSQVPVIPCLVKGSEKALPKGARFFKRSNITVYIGDPIEPKSFKYESDKKNAYKLFSKKIMSSIAQLGKRYGD